MAESAVLNLMRQHRERIRSSESQIIGNAGDNLQESAINLSGMSRERSLNNGTSSEVNSMRALPSKYEQLQQTVLLLQQQVMRLQEQQSQRSKDSELLAVELDKLRAEVQHLKSPQGIHLQQLGDNSDLAETELRSAMAKLQAEVLEHGKLMQNTLKRLDKVQIVETSTPDSNSIEEQLGGTSRTDDPSHVRTFQWGETVWEASIFLWLPRLGVAQSVSLMLAILVNVAIQSYLCYILVTDEAFGRYKSMESDVRKWRLVDGHHAKYLDTEDFSLAARVCGLDYSLSVAGAQVELLQEVNSYFSWTDPFDLQVPAVPTGPILCMVSISFFALLIIREIAESVLFARTLWSLPRHKTQLTDTQLVSVSPRRFAASLVICAARITVAVILLYSGIYWLGDTSSIEELILNSAALGFVMEIDELLFMTLARGHVIELVRSLDPIRTPREPSFVEALVPAAMFITILFLSWYGVVSPFMDNMLALKTELCGGTLDFVCEPQKALGLVWSRGTPTFKPPAADMNTQWSQAVEELKSRQSAVSVAYPQTVGWVGDISATTQFSVYLEDKDVYDASVAERTAQFGENPPCIDQEAKIGLAAWFNGIRFEAALFSEQLGLPPVSFEGPFRCAAFKGFCNMPFLDILRLMCPVTCGCNDRASGLYVVYQSQGCPRSCVEEAIVKQQNMDCVDANLASSVENANWNQYWQSWKEGETKSGIVGWTSAKDTFHQSILLNGCDGELIREFISSARSTTDPCIGREPYNSLMAFCPKTCCDHLNISESLQCPRKCKVQVVSSRLFR